MNTPELNTAFKQESSHPNMAFNNILFSCEKIRAMHDTAKRLYLAALVLQKTSGQSNVARLLNTSPQTVKNWETRGVSKNGMIDAERFIGCRSAWIETGDGEMEDSSNHPIYKSNTFPEERPYLSLESFPFKEISGTDPHLSLMAGASGGASNSGSVESLLSPSSDTQTASTPAQSQAQLINLSEHPGLKEVPRVKFKLSAGVSGYAVEPEEGNGKPIFFREDWFKTNGYDPTKLFAVLVSGQSMETSLWDGDLVVINTADTKPHDGDVYAINYEGELVIKRMRRDFGQWLATSDNTDQRRYAPKRCSEDVKIIGRVVYKQSERI